MVSWVFLESLMRAARLYHLLNRHSSDSCDAHSQKIYFPKDLVILQT